MDVTCCVFYWWPGSLEEDAQVLGPGVDELGVLKGLKGRQDSTLGDGNYFPHSDGRGGLKKRSIL